MLENLSIMLLSITPKIVSLCSNYARALALCSKMLGEFYTKYGLTYYLLQFLFLLLFVVTTWLRARSESCGLRNQLKTFVTEFTESAVVQSSRDATPNWKSWKPCCTLKLTGPKSQAYSD